VETFRPLLVLLASHWLSLAGVVLVTTAVILWILLLAFASGSGNPYLGILFYLLIPGVFFLGLILMPAGAWLAKEKLRKTIAGSEDAPRAIRRVLVFLGVTTAANLLLGTQFTYHAVEHMETDQFCGQSCHVMQPAFRASEVAGHSKVACVHCHVAPGAAGWFASKMAGTRQMIEVVFDSYPRPIASGLESGRLVGAEQTCERCHSRGRFLGAKLRVKPKYADDEKNTTSHTVLMLLVGGGAGWGIHGAHLDPDIEIRYTAADGKRQQIPWVEWRRKSTGEVREYVAAGGRKEGGVFEMQCVDCHNRPAHSFETPEAALDRALALGEIPIGLPFARKTSLELLRARYSSQSEADEKIRSGFESFYEKSYPDTARGRRADVKRAAGAVSSIYSRNVFPDLKVDWGTYPNNAGHTDFPGCFRCHDADHSTKDGKVIGQDCASCHEVLAAEETDPEILRKLNLAGRLANLQKP
jgi:hypothetical protein